MHDQAPNTKTAPEKLAEMFIILQRSFVLNLSKQLIQGRISYPQFLLLSFLDQEKEPLNMTEVARRMQHTTAAATGLVDRLAKLDLIRRENGSKDRRKVFVAITTKGIDIVREIHQDMVKNINHLMTFLDESEQAAWLRIYEKIFPHCKQG